VLLGVLAAWFALRDAAAPTKQVSGATAPLATATMTAPGPVRPPVIPIPRAAVLPPPNSNLGGSALAAFDKERVPDPEPLAPPEPQRVSRKTAPPVPLSSPPEPEPAAAASESGWGQMKTTIKRTN